MKIYTGFGDKGETSLFGGRKVSKADLRVDAYGNIDELNAFVGFSRSICKDEEMKIVLKKMQEYLFNIGAELSAPDSKNIQEIKEEDRKFLENVIDKYAPQVSELNSFILPSGSQLSASLHMARTVCRRAERTVVALSKKEKVNGNLLSFLNRLSSLLFVLARIANKRNLKVEEQWKGR